MTRKRTQLGDRLRARFTKARRQFADAEQRIREAQSDGVTINVAQRTNIVSRVNVGGENTVSAASSRQDAPIRQNREAPPDPSGEQGRESSND